jgi:predicted RNA binding protein YcfA (HicA-like mRNA interferase family)
MKVRKVSEIIKQLEDAGWYLYRHNGSSHRQFKHGTIKGKVTVNHRATLAVVF